ncbi:MAG: tRNA-specific 2-thiouridylase [Bacteriovoracaceae bacterium]|jgi:tRNA U34 2-thiouridine synthase MnmA/TrmU|nr:tRNA-specific 2-thiouridylase [Bacteriovoracaceae bacterium]
MVYKSNIVKKGKKIIYALSHSRESKLGALLLKKQGYDVHCINFFVNHVKLEKYIDDTTCKLQKNDVLKEFCSGIGVTFLSEDITEIYYALYIKNKISHILNFKSFDPQYFYSRVILEGLLRVPGFSLFSSAHFCKNVIMDDGSIHLCLSSQVERDCSYYFIGIDSNILKSFLFPLGEIGQNEIDSLCDHFSLSDSPLNSLNNSKNIDYVPVNLHESYSLFAAGVQLESNISANLYAKKIETKDGQYLFHYAEHKTKNVFFHVEEKLMSKQYIFKNTMYKSKDYEHRVQRVYARIGNLYQEVTMIPRHYKHLYVEFSKKVYLSSNELISFYQDKTPGSKLIAVANTLRRVNEKNNDTVHSSF